MRSSSLNHLLLAGLAGSAAAAPLPSPYAIKAPSTSIKHSQQVGGEGEAIAHIMRSIGSIDPEQINAALQRREIQTRGVGTTMGTDILTGVGVGVGTDLITGLLGGGSSSSEATGDTTTTTNTDTTVTNSGDGSVNNQGDQTVTGDVTNQGNVNYKSTVGGISNGGGSVSRRQLGATIATDIVTGVGTNLITGLLGGGSSSEATGDTTTTTTTMDTSTNSGDGSVNNQGNQDVSGSVTNEGNVNYQSSVGGISNGGGSVRSKRDIFDLIFGNDDSGPTTTTTTTTDNTATNIGDGSVNNQGDQDVSGSVINTGNVNYQSSVGGISNGGGSIRSKRDIFDFLFGSDDSGPTTTTTTTTDNTATNTGDGSVNNQGDQTVTGDVTNEGNVNIGSKVGGISNGGGSVSKRDIFDFLFGGDDSGPTTTTTTTTDNTYTNTGDGSVNNQGDQTVTGDVTNEGNVNIGSSVGGISNGGGSVSRRGLLNTVLSGDNSGDGSINNKGDQTISGSLTNSNNENNSGSIGNVSNGGGTLVNIDASQLKSLLSRRNGLTRRQLEARFPGFLENLFKDMNSSGDQTISGDNTNSDNDNNSGLIGTYGTNGNTVIVSSRSPGLQARQLGVGIATGVATDLISGLFTGGSGSESAGDTTTTTNTDTTITNSGDGSVNNQGDQTVTGSVTNEGNVNIGSSVGGISNGGGSIRNKRSTWNADGSVVQARAAAGKPRIQGIVLSSRDDSTTTTATGNDNNSGVINSSGINGNSVYIPISGNIESNLGISSETVQAIADKLLDSRSLQARNTAGKPRIQGIVLSARDGSTTATDNDNNGGVINSDGINGNSVYIPISGGIDGFLGVSSGTAEKVADKVTSEYLS